MANKKSKGRRDVHNIRDIFPKTDLLEGATLVQAEDGTHKIEGITIIKAGLSKNGNFYSPATLRKAAKDGVFDGKTIRTDHSELGTSQSVNDIVGMVKEGWYDEKESKLRGNVFFSSTVSDLVTKVKEGLVGDLSINARGVTRMERVGDKLQRNVKEITEGFSVDLVCDASAGGTLHEEYNRARKRVERMKQRMDELEKLSLDDLKEARSDLVDKIREEALAEAAKAKADKDNVEDKKEAAPSITPEKVTELVTESVTKIFDARDKKDEERAVALALVESLTKAVTEVLTECDQPDPVKAHIAVSLAPFASANFKDLASIDKKKLSEERDRLLSEFEVLIKEHSKHEPGKKTGETKGNGSGEKTGRITDCLVL